MAERTARSLHPDTLAGLVLLALAALGFWLTTGFREVPAMLSQNVPPTFFPRLVLILIGGMSLALAVGGRRRQDAAEREPIGRIVFATAALILAAPVAIWLVGTWPSLALSCLCLPLLWGERRMHLIALLALGLPAFVYLVFGVALGLRFPAGLIASAFS